MAVRHRGFSRPALRLRAPAALRETASARLIPRRTWPRELRDGGEVTLLVAAIRIAGLIQLADVSANLVLPKKIQCRENLARVSPIMRQVFLVHWLYILLTLVIFGLACLLFAPELAG